MSTMTNRLRKLRLDIHFMLNSRKPWVYHLKNGDLAYIWKDEISYKLFTTHNFEDNNRSLWEKIVQPGMTVFDVGANWGIYTLAASRLTGETGQVFSFEPNPLERDKLQKNLDLNSGHIKQKVTVRSEAVGDYSGTTSFHIPLDFKGAYGSIKKPDIVENCEEINVQLTTIDAFVKENEVEAIDALKIDVEGNELNVLMGAKASLQHFQPFVFMEVSDRRTKVYDYKANKLCQILLDHNYDLFTPGDFDESGQPTAVAYVPTEYISYVDVFAVPKRFGSDWLKGHGISVVHPC